MITHTERAPRLDHEFRSTSGDSESVESPPRRDHREPLPHVECLDMVPPRVHEPVVDFLEFPRHAIGKFRQRLFGIDSILSERRAQPNRPGRIHDLLDGHHTKAPQHVGHPLDVAIVR